MNTLMVSDHVKWEKVLERVQTINEQLQRAVNNAPSDERMMIVGDQQGFKICLG